VSDFLPNVSINEHK